MTKRTLIKKPANAEKIKRITISFFFLTMLYPCVEGQWYTRKYGVADIYELPQAQLEQSLSTYTYVTIGGCGCIILGGLMVVAGSTMYRDGLPEDPTFMEDLLGARTIRSLYKGSGCILAATGIIAAFTGNSRSNDIKRVLREKYSIAEITLKPAIFDIKSGPVYPGIYLSFNF